jgi:NAD(P)-dependent dehydrogenase (short-subunit alcohol dehydrogenase family)
MTMKNILITGVSTGIGYNAVHYFVGQGFKVFGSVRTDSDAQRLKKDFSHNFTCLQFDVTDVAQIEKAKTIVEETLSGGALDALVNNAGYVQSGPMALISDQAFRRQIEVNLFGVRNVTNAFLPLLGADKAFTGTPGKIINISSISGIFNTPMNGAYCVAKHSLESLGEVYRRELMMYGIQVISIQPGPIQSDLWDKNANSMEAYLQSDYGVYAHNAARIIDNAQLHALPAEVISKLIHTIINSRRPRLSYIVTRNKWLNTVVTRYLPRRVVDYFLYRSLSRE